MPMNLLPPMIEHSYPSAELAIEIFNRHAASEGYAIVKARTTRYQGILYRLYLACDRGGRYRARPTSLRQSSSRMTQCPFSLVLKSKDDVWVAYLRCGDHNHEPSDPIAHPVHRRLPAAAIRAIQEQSQAKATPRQIVAELRNAGVNLLGPAAIPPIARDIYNARAKIRSERLGASGPTQTAIALLQGDEWFHECESDETGLVQRLFLAHSRSRENLRAAHEVLIMDCTHKTNRSKMPLFSILGVTPYGRSFHVAFAFLKQESKTDYIWALERLRRLYSAIGIAAPRTLLTERNLGLMAAISEVYPTTRNMLCLWHVSKNVLARCGPMFETEDRRAAFLQAWQEVLDAPNTTEYEAALSRLRILCADVQGAIRYLEDTWLPHKEALVRAWTDSIFHLGLRSTSRVGRVEGAQSTPKGFLQVKADDMKGVLDRINVLLSNQAVELRHSGALARTRIDRNLRIPLFAQVLGSVSPTALRKVHIEHRRPRDSLEPCTGVFTATLGLPCAHVLRDLAARSETLKPSHFHPYWLFDRPLAPITAVAAQRTTPLPVARDAIAVSSPSQPTGS